MTNLGHVIREVKPTKRIRLQINNVPKSLGWESDTGMLLITSFA